jgi:hypothetical protein
MLKTTTRKAFPRRRFLRGLGGVAIGLPALDVFLPRLARGQAAPARKIYSALLLQQNGCIQGRGGDPDLYWPKAMGAIDPASMAGAEAAQTTSELAAYASKVIFVRGMNFKYSRNHDGGPIAASCGSPVTGTGTKQLPVSESIDYYIARNLTPGKEPLTLYAGKKGTFRDDALSFGTGGVLRVGDNNPINVFNRLSGLAGVMQNDPALAQKIAARRLSVNDLVRGDLKALLARTDLSKADRDRLDLHLSSVREMEIKMTTTLGPMLDTAGMMAVSGQQTTDANMEKVVRMMCDLIAFAFASDRARSATLQIGGCNDHTRYTINGVQQPPYHYISHRIQSDGDSGAAIPDAVNLHHEIDRIHARYFKYFLDRVSMYTMPEGGTLLDASVNIWTNSVADGPPHSGTDVPYVIAGSGAGFLRTGIHVRSTGPSHRILNTVINAVGIRKANGDLVNDFGDPSTPGMVTEIHA